MCTPALAHYFSSIRRETLSEMRTVVKDAHDRYANLEINYLQSAPAPGREASLAGVRSAGL